MRYRIDISQFRTLGYVLFFLTIVDNRYMEYKPVLFAIYTLRVVFAAMGYYLVLRNLKTAGRTKHVKLLFLQVLLSFAAIFSGVINRNITFGIIYTIFIWVGITSYVLNSAAVNIAFLKTIDNMFKLLAIITLLLAVIVPDAIVTYSYDGSRIVEGFFGGKNVLSPYLLTGLCLNLLVYEIKGGNKLWYRYIYPLVCILLLSYSGSGTGSVIALIFMTLFYTQIYKRFNVFNIIITHTALFFFIVVYRLQERFLYPIIVNVLHRDLTLTSRTDIWSISIKFFTNGWLMGYGLGNTAIADNLMLPSWYTQTINETHNGILDIALNFGILGLIPFLIFIIIVIKEYDKSENKGFSQIMKLYVFVYFVIAISESAFTISRLTFWVMLFIGLVIQRCVQTGKFNLKGKDRSK